MQIILNAPGIHQRTKEAVEKELEEMMPRLKRILFQFRPEEKTMRAHLAVQKNNEFRLTLSIRMPGKNIMVERSGHNLIPLITEVKQGLLEQIKVQTSVIRKDRLRQKSTQQGEAIQEAIGDSSMLSAAEADEELFRDRFTTRLRFVLQDVHSHVSRLIRFSQLAGDLQPNYLKPSEVVDDIILRAYERIRKNPSEEISTLVLYQIAEGIVLDEIRSCKDSMENMVSMQENVPAQSPHWEVNDLNDEILEFYQPEEVLRYADIMPDIHVPDPIRVLNEDEQMRDISLCLSTVSPLVRGAFLLNRVEGFDIYEIALMQGRDEDQISKDIGTCEELLIKTYTSWS
jgi:DNA-directed RNA polymerase specialized sigma24 family protein